MLIGETYAVYAQDTDTKIGTLISSVNRPDDGTHYPDIIFENDFGVAQNHGCFYYRLGGANNPHNFWYVDFGKQDGTWEVLSKFYKSFEL